MTYTDFNNVVTVFLLIVTVITVVRRFFNLPPVVGYIAVGSMLGPYIEPETLIKIEQLGSGGHLGIAFLLFSIGLELPIKRIVNLRKSFLIGLLQVIISTLLIIPICLHLNFGIIGSIAVAGALSLSSTAVVIKQLTEQNEINQKIGNISLSILLLQDLAAVPFLIIVPFLAKHGAHNLGHELMIVCIFGVLYFIIMMLAGKFILTNLFKLATSPSTPELFLITALFVAISSGWVTEQLGLSMELGTFLTGVILADSNFAHQIRKQIRPFRDIFLGIFFIGIGVNIDIKVIIDYYQELILAVTSLFIFKAAIITFLTYKIADANRKTCIKTGICLAQAGELGLALMSTALPNLADKYHDIALSTMVISLAISPLLIKYSNNIANFLIRSDETCSESMKPIREFDYTKFYYKCPRFNKIKIIKTSFFSR